MIQKDYLPLHKMFPRRMWVRNANKYLNRISGMTLQEQLRDRKITKIQIRKLLCPAGLATNENGFVIFISDLISESEYALSIGHELGHTFHFDLSSNEPRNLYTRPIFKLKKSSWIKIVLDKDRILL
ncbi:hypothetical protein KW783_02545 [Candidatus Parcubacteria bacterium]|nr:hypothetical protein [Candidatus Parcubacteria bacterium]